MALRGIQEFPEKAGNQTSQHQPLMCPDMTPSSTVPTTVHRVKPADVKIIAALGDSLTTAIGENATNIIELLFEYRHLSWSIGGYGNFSDIITLPNIFRLFNPNLVGAAPKRTLSTKPSPLEDTALNLAVTGANTYEFPEQTRNLVDSLKTYPGISFENDWKVVTIFIGGNDLCDYCKNKTLFSADSFIHNLTISLDMLHQELPRTIVNVVQVFWMESLREVNDGSLGCLLQKSFCSCLVLPQKNSTEIQELLDQNVQFQKKLEALIDSGRYDDKEDFAVVLQPFLKKAQAPKLSNGSIDYSYFALDCFHFTIKGHEELAKGLWNNMLQPEGEKFEIETLSKPVQLICPSQDHPYIYTRKSSKGSLAPPILNGSYPIILLILILELGFW
ncbi:phospholipase B1, membrane-associated isoform X2 [Microcaecilia unicolor]|nr:phospholipase B1, membrane-associated isoform X2 [Microcaecilia unicolor]